MKNLFLILGVFLPLFSFSQSHKVITTDNKVYIGDINYVSKRYLNFWKVEPPVEPLDITLVKEIYGKISEYSKNKVLKTNSKIIFYPDYYGEVDSKNSLITKQISSGDHIQKAGKYYLAGTGLYVAGSALVITGALIDSNDVPEALYIAGGATVVSGFICTVLGHFELVKAGKAMNDEAITLSPSKEGIGLAINF